jgi:hypothetical protein
MAYDQPDDTKAEPKPKDRTKYYVEAIDRYNKGSQEWRERCEKIVKIYLDQHRNQNSQRRFALLWSNTETLKPAVYARLPQAVVSRRFKDSDKAGRKAAEVMERCINTSFDLYGIDEVMRNVRDDRLLVARGTAWTRYDATVEGEQVTLEHVCYDFVHWSDFGHALARTWSDVNLVWRRVYMTRAKARKRFGKLADNLSYEVRPELGQRQDTSRDAFEPQAVIFEIWDKDDKQTTWLDKEGQKTLEAGSPPLNLRNFYPCPEPTYGTRSTGSLIPTPDYRYYQDQAEEIDDLTAKIAALSEWLKVKAFIPAGPSSEGGDAIVQLLQELTNKAMDKGIFVPVESWAGFAEKGGSRLIDWLPIDMVVATIKAAIECRQQLIQDVYEITGISDILRGESDPNETLGAQQIKAQTGSRRISTMQRDIARFARDLAEITGEIIGEVFQPQTMSDMSGMDLTAEAPPELLMQRQQLMMLVQQAQQQPQPQMMAGPNGGMPPPAGPPPQVMEQLQQIDAQLEEFQLNAQVLQILRDEKTRGFRVEIETDSTIEPDEQAEKQSRVEFLTAVGGFIQQAAPVLQVKPQLTPMISEMLQFLVRGFRAGRSLEDVIERSMGELNKAAQQPPPPDPQIAIAEKKLEQDQQNHQAELVAQQDANRAKLAQDQLNANAKLQQAQQQHIEAMALEREKHAQTIAQQALQHTNTMDAKQREMKMNQDGKKEEREFNRQSKMDDAASKESERGTQTAISSAIESLAEATQALGAVGQSIEHAAEVMAAPDELIRDKTGRATGRRKVMPKRTDLQ